MDEYGASHEAKGRFSHLQPHDAVAIPLEHQGLRTEQPGRTNSQSHMQALCRRGCVQEKVLAYTVPLRTASVTMQYAARPWSPRWLGNSSRRSEMLALLVEIFGPQVDEEVEVRPPPPV